MAALAAALAAKKRAEKMGLANEEVDETNVGKQGDEALKNPFLGKLNRSQPNPGQLSPRSRRLAEMASQANKENEIAEKPKVEAKTAPPPPPPPPVQAQTPAITPVRQIDINTPYSVAVAENISQLVSMSPTSQQLMDSVTLVQRWNQRENSRADATSSPLVYDILASVATSNDSGAREYAVSTLMELCEDGQVRERMHESGAAFAGLQRMMACPHEASAAAATQLLVSLCEMDTADFAPAAQTPRQAPPPPPVT
eukprot:CAMPEP_0113690612 /NCGR_PEP_ID=MMETSP0038_2-20120614/17899_1 /TAXON_ID=2898 /ORGANISM="Cryptomonas paramecium" /LENGTH=254 /DNA_ID=CAMNT_0000611979 /DNA_START=52 /DNA_END=812 /DNA_ORIENTATION=- /assembly_acc=CAM_ASM_000170